MNKKRNRLLSLGFVLGAGALMLAACGDSSTSANDGDSSSSSAKESSSSVSSSSVKFSSSSAAVVSSSSSSVKISSSSSSAKVSSSSVSSSSAKVSSSSVSSSSAKVSSSSVSSSSAKVSSSSVSSSSVKVSSSSSSAKVSSSSVSSSSATVSSSSAIAYGIVTYGGQYYKTVKIGTQTWMAENLNYADSSTTPNLKGTSWCYKNNEANCATYGRLYTWTAAMNIDSSYQSNDASSVTKSVQQGICPLGWHIPNDDEWQTLYDYVDENNGDDGVGTSLKASTGWDILEGVATGKNTFGFSALPGACQGGCTQQTAQFWSSTQYWLDDKSALLRALNYDTETFATLSGEKFYGFSVRCVKN